MKKFLTAAAFLVASLGVNAQNLIASFSPLHDEEQKKLGLSNNIIGSNKDHIYVESLEYKAILRGKFYAKSVKVKIIKKSDLTTSKIVEIYSKSKPEDKPYFIFSYKVASDRIFVFYRERKTKEFKAIYGRTFDLDWNPTSTIKELYKFPNLKEFRQTDFLFSYNTNATKILVGAEFPAKQGGSPYVDYKILDEKFEQINNGKFEMPVKITGKRANTSNSKFSMTGDGNIFFTTTISMTDDEKKEKQKGEDTYYTNISVVKSETGDIKTTPVKFSGKNIFYTRMLFNDNETKIIGFYSDLEDDKTGDKISGIFTAVVNMNDLSLTKSDFKRFTKEDILALEGYDLTKKRDAKAAKKITDGNAALSSSLIIENFETDDKGNIFLFCNNLYNYQRTVCSGSGARRTCTTYYYCEKSQTYIFKILSSGELAYAKRFPRLHTYDRYSVYDQKVFEANNKFYVTYMTDFDHDSASMGLKKSKKPRVSRNEKLEYLVVDATTDKIERKFLNFNSPDAKKSRRKYIIPEALTTVGDEWYGVQTDYYTPAGIQVMNTVLSLGTIGLYYFIGRPMVKRATWKSKTEYVRVFAN